MKKYTQEDLETDLEWFEGLGVDNDEAKKYINFLLQREKAIGVELE